MGAVQRLFVGLLTLVLAVGLSAPVVPVAGAATQITVLQSAEPESLDPSAEVLTHQINVYHQIIESLVAFTPQARPFPDLAVSWKNIDPLTWEIQLRRNVRFTDGEPFNSDAVVETFKYFTRPGSLLRANLLRWNQVVKVDDSTVRVTTNGPDADFLFGMSWFFVLPPRILRSNPASLADHPIGTGPYKLVRWVKGERIVLAANDEYWRGRPKIDQVTIESVPEASARIAALLNRQADVIVNVPPDSVDNINRSAVARVDSATSLRNVTIMFDPHTPPFEDLRARQAMNYAVDKEAIIKNIFHGRALIQATPSQPVTFGHNSAVKPYPYDVQKAKALLAQAGYPNGFSVEFHHPTGRWLQDADVAQAVAGMLQQVGVRTTLSTGEYGTFFATYAKGAYKGMTMIGTLNNIAADQVVQMFLYSKGMFPFNYHDATLDAMYDHEQQVLNDTQRGKLLQDMEAYINKQAPWLFLYFQYDLYGASRRLTWIAPSNERMTLWSATVR